MLFLVEPESGQRCHYSSRARSASRSGVANWDPRRRSSTRPRASGCRSRSIPSIGKRSRTGRKAALANCADAGGPSCRGRPPRATSPVADSQRPDYPGDGAAPGPRRGRVVVAGIGGSAPLAAGPTGESEAAEGQPWPRSQERLRVPRRAWRQSQRSPVRAGVEGPAVPPPTVTPAGGWMGRASPGEQSPGHQLPRSPPR